MKHIGSRFECPSSLLEANALMRRSSVALWGAAALALAMHACFSVVGIGPSRESRAAKPLTTRFVKRQPRLTKPLEMRRKPRPKARLVQRTMVTIRAKARTQQTIGVVQPAQILGRLAHPRALVQRGATFASDVVEPGLVARIADGKRDPKDMVDMSLEMLDVDALDTGRYQAMVIQDPEDKRNIRGFFHLAIVYIPSIAEKNALHSLYGLGRGHYLSTPLALPALVEAMNKYTAIKTDMKGMYPIDSGQVLEVPWVMVIPSFNFKLTQSEAENLGEYLMNGGFLYGDDGRHNIASVSCRALKVMYEDALATQGLVKDRDFAIQVIPQEHEIYHCYFDFDNPPYGTDDHAERDTGGRNTQTFGVNYAVQYIWGVFAGDRMLGTVNPKSYGWVWECAIVGDVRDGGQKHVDYERSLQFGVNMVIFALTQEGSVTRRVMDTVGY